MSVTFHNSRNDCRSLHAVLGSQGLEASNEALETAMAGCRVDPYGETKLLALHVARSLALPVDRLARETRAGFFEAMRDLEVVYVVGE